MARPYLGNPKYTIEVLQKYHFVFQKRFGQNFLIDEHVLEKIIESSGITKDDFILEIGPGIGTMTQYLGQRSGVLHKTAPLTTVHRNLSFPVLPACGLQLPSAP